MQGQFFDEETELAYNRFSYYSPDTGTYISQDPIGLSGGDNVYAYVQDVNLLIDPLGLVPLGTKGFSVYGLFEKGAEKPYYVGYSSDTDARTLSHINDKRMRGNDILQLLYDDINMSIEEARGKEQYKIEEFHTKTGIIGQDLSEDGLTAEQRGNKINSFDKARALDPKDVRGIAFNEEYEKAKKADAKNPKIKCK